MKFFKEKKLLKTISGQSFSSGRAKINIKIGKISKPIKFYIIKNNNFKYQLLLGLDAIKEFKLIQDEKLKIHQKVEKPNSKLELVNLCINNNQKLYQHPNNDKDKHHSSSEDLTSEQNNKIKKLIEKFSNCFASGKFDVGRMKSGEAQVKLLVDKYVSLRPYRCSLPDKKEIDNQIQQLLQADLIEPSSSPFAAPITLVYKKEEGRRSRLCIDFKSLNRIVVPECQPFPRIEDIMERTIDCEYFSTLDINSAFWSVPVKEEDKEKLAFVTEDGHYQWKVLPFGYRNSPLIFQRILSRIIKSRSLNRFAMNYMDDIIIFSKSFEEHLDHLKQFFKAVEEERFKLKLSKCDFAKKSVRYLGHIIAKNKIQPLNDGLLAIKEFPIPSNRKQVRQFLGKVNYYHKFIPNCAERLEPLHHLLRKDTSFVWSENCTKAFEDLKHVLCSAPVLQIFDSNKDIVICTDASKMGVAAIMKQEDKEGILHPVAYFSKKLTPGQIKKDAIYIECLAIKQAIVFWQHQLLGRHFIVLTDHKPLENLKVKARPDTPLGDLVLFLSQYNFKIIYRQGKSNIEADTLSRNPVLETFDDEEIIQTSNLLLLEEIKLDQTQNSVVPRHNIIKEQNILCQHKDDKKRIIISEKLGLELVNRTHLEFGHIGSKTISDMITPFYSVPNLQNLIRRTCESCEVCIKNKTRCKRPIGYLEKFIKPTQSFQMMSLDTVGGFAGNNSTKKYLHILTDHFTKYAWISTSSKQTAKDFIKLVESIANDNKIGTILFDQYTGINSKEFRKYLKSKDIDFIFSPIDHPSSNGAVERLGQTLVNRIRCKFNESNNTRSWASVAEECVQEYNKTLHQVTKFSPRYLLSGKKNDMCPLELNQTDLEADRRKAFDNTEIFFQKNKKRIDKNRSDEQLAVGDYVMVDEGSKQNRNKLDIIRNGPFVIVEQISPLMFRVDAGRRKSTSNMFHKNQLHPFPGFSRGKEM